MYDIFLRIQQSKPNFVNWFDFNKNQLQANEQGVYPVSFPCLLIDFDTVGDAVTFPDGSQQITQIVKLTYAEKVLSRTHANAPNPTQNEGLQVLARAQLVLSYAQSLQDSNFSKLVSSGGVRRVTRGDLHEFEIELNTIVFLATPQAETEKYTDILTPPSDIVVSVEGAKNDNRLPEITKK